MHVLFALTDVSAWQYLSGNFGERGLGTAKSTLERRGALCQPQEVPQMGWTKQACRGRGFVGVRGVAVPTQSLTSVQFRCNSPAMQQSNLIKHKMFLQKSSMWFMISYLIGLCQPLTITGTKCHLWPVCCCRWRSSSEQTSGSQSGLILERQPPNRLVLSMSMGPS